MPDPSQITEVFSDMFSGAAASSTSSYMFYFTYVLWGILILGFFALMYFLIAFKYKLTIREGSIEKNGDGNEIRILKVRKDRAMITNKGGVRQWKLLFGWKTIDPVDFKYIQPGNHVDLFTTDGTTFNPMPLSVGNPSASFKVDSFDVSSYFLGVRKDAMTYQKDDVLKRQQIAMIATIVFCLILVGLTIYFSLKAATHTADKIEIAANAWEGLKGIAPN